MGYFDKYNKQREQGTYQAPAQNASRKDVESAIQEMDPVGYANWKQQEAIDMWNSYVYGQQRREQEALDEYSHGRGNRSYLREGMADGSYQAGMAAAKDQRTTAQKRIDKLLGVDSSQVTGEKTDWGKIAKGAWYKGADQFSTSMVGGLNWLFGDAAEQIHSLGVETINGIIGGVNNLTGANIKPVENKGNLLTNWYETLKETKAHNEKVFSANANSSKAAQIVDNFGTSFVAAVPMALEAVFMGYAPGIDAAARGLDLASPLLNNATTAGLQYVSGLQTAKGLQAAGMMARQSASTLMQNPQFWSSYVQAIGDSAENAEESGMSPRDAAIYTMINGFFNAAIEVGGADETLGGIQNFPMRLRQLEAQGGKKAVVEWFKDSVLGEGLEEVAQGIFERGVKAPATGAKVASLDPGDTDAIFNPWTSAQEFTGGAVVGGLLGGGQTVIQGGVQKINDNRAFKGDAQTLLDSAKQSGGEQYAAQIREIEQAAKGKDGSVKLNRGQARQLYDIIESSGAAEQYRETVNQKDADSLVSTVFSGSGITLDENQRGRLMETLNDSKAGVKDFAIGTRDAYNMGEQGATMEETVQAIGEKYGLSPKQARTAWSFGASNAQTTATGTADVSTEEGRQTVEAALSFLGERTEDAVKIYDSRQDVGRMATAMNKAVLYAAHGADVQETVQNAREGKAADVVGVLTDEQAKLAQEIGNEKRARQQAADKALGESYRDMRQKAAAITGTTTVSAQALEAVDTAIDATRKAGQRVMDEFNTLYNALEALEKADPNAKNSNTYKEMLDRAYKLRDKAQNAKKQIRELEKRKAQIEGKKTIQRRKGTVSFAGGTIEGVKYDGVDPAKLSRQQQKVVAMVERLADAVNLDYVFISADAGMGGAYTFGGRVYININAGLGVGNFSQTMAAASLSHEMTHWMQQYAPEEYSQLKDFIVQEILKADPQKLQKLIQQQKAWEKGRALTDEQALDEVVANACQTMLMDSKAINKLARQNMSLAARIADWIADWSQKVKDAFAEVDTSQGAIYEAVRALDGSLDRIQELWDNGIEAAAQSYNAEQTVRAASAEASTEANENAAQNIGDVQNQTWSEAEEDYRQEQELETQIREAEDALDFEEDEKVRRPLENRLVKLRADYDKLVAKERRLSKKTSIDEILNNLSRYRYNDLESIANQFSDGAWDIEPGTPREQLEEELRDALEERAADMTPLQRQAPKMGFFVRPVESGKQTKMQYIGESAETADKDALALARQLEKQGVDNESIRQQTGWFNGMDGKWRYEIPGNRMEYYRFGDARFRQDHPEYAEYQDLMDKVLTGELTEAEEKRLSELDRTWGNEIGRLSEIVERGSGTLDMILQFDELFEAYPQLRKIRVEFDDIGKQGLGGSYDDKRKSIVLGNHLKRDPIRAKAVLAHEIQHAIQHIEGFTPGASAEYWSYRLNAGYRQEVEKKADQKYNALFDGAPEELKNKIRAYNRARIDKNWELADELENELYDSEYADLFSAIDNADFERRNARYAEYNPVDMYYNTAGEIEARDAERRSTWDESKRKLTPPNLGNSKTIFSNWDDGPQFQQWSDEEYEELTGSLNEDQLYSAITERKSEENQLREQIKEMKPKEKEWVDKVSAKEATLDDFQAWTETSGYKAMLDRKEQLEKEIRMLYDRWEKARDNRLEREEKEALEKSGLSENEYFGKQAVKVFGYTPYFYDAGYIMSNGKMLNFSGEKGKHRGSRGQDHRAIGQIFATTQNSAAMTRFMNYGNIRIMGESPGIDISSKVEPTAEQYRQIKAFARNVADEEYFSVDLSDERGNNVGTLEYDGTIRPDRIINDIKHFFQTGEVRGAGLSAFYQRWDNTDGDTAAEANGREEAYTRLQSENKILKDTVKALNKLTGKQSTTIEKLQERLRLNKTPEVREDDAKKMARSLLREYGSKTDSEAVARQLKEIGDYILQTSTDKVSEEEIKSRARAVAAEIIDAASEQISVDGEYMAEIVSSIRGKKLTIDDAFLGELDQAGGFEEFRRRNFGKFTLAKRSGSYDASQYMSVSQFYTDLQNNYGKSYFPDAANEGEEIIRIADAFDLARPMEVNPFEQYMGEAVEDLANRIAMDTMGGILRAEPAKYADVEYRKEKSRNEELNERIKKLEAENALTHEEAGRLWNQVSDLTRKLDLAETQYAALQKAAEARLAQVRAEGRERAAEAMARERARGERKNQKLKEHYQEIMQAARERRQEAAGAGKYRKQIEKKAAKLYEMLAKNDDKLHVPEVLKQPLGEFLESLDFTSKRGLAGGEETQKDKTFALRLQKIQQILTNQQDYINGGDMKQDLGGYIDVSKPNLDFLRRVSEMITTALSENRDFTINQMTAADLKDLSNFLSNLTTAIRNMNNFMANARFESVREAASQDIESIKALGKASETENGKLFSAAVWENGTPYYVFRRFGEGGKAIFDSFTRGWEKMAFNVQKVMDFTEETYSDKEVREWQKERHEIELEDGSKVTMTTGQIMSLSMLLNREQARKHMDKGGVRIGDIQGKKGAIKDTTHYHLTETDISNIIGQLTDRQAEVARKLQRFMAEQGAEWGNEISMRRFGYNFYTEGENYFPIKTDSADQPMRDTDAQQNSMFRLLNLSASKSLNPKASNALVVEDIFDVFADHMSDMAKLNGMGLPILDAIKWFNYKERIDLGDGQYDTRTMQGAMEQAFGDKALSYFRTLMKDINGVTESGDRGTDVFSKLMSNYKAASVAANLRVAFLQPTSYVRASYLIKPRFLMQAFTNHNAYKEAMENSGTAVWKSLGYYDTNIARGMREQIKHDDSWKDKAVEKSMKLAEIGDQRTWGRLWVACKMQTAAETGLQGEELEQKTADLFREVIYSSQVMDSTLTRSELMRGKTMYSKAMTSFMAEPTLSYNMVMDAGMEYHMNARKYGKAKAWQMSKGYIAKAFTVYACSATFSAVVESVFDALRDDDDDESFFDKWKQAMFGEGNLLTGNLAQDMTIIGKLPYLKSFVSTIQGYKSGDMSLAAFSTAIDAVKIWKETIDLARGALDKPTKTTYYGNMTTWGKIYKTMQAFSQFTGLAVANLSRDVFAVWNTTVGAFKPEWKVRTYESSGDRKRREAVKELTEQGVPKKLALQALQEPDADGSGSLKQDELGPWLNEKIESGEITGEQADAIWGTQGWKTSFSDYSAKAQKKAQAETQPEVQPETSSVTPTPMAKPAATPKPTPQANLSGFESFKKSVSLYSDKKESAYQGWENEVKPLGVSLDSYVKIINAADAAGDGNGSVRQDEMGMQLVQRINRRELTYEQAEAIWHTIWSGARSKTFYKWYNG